MRVYIIGSRPRRSEAPHIARRGSLSRPMSASSFHRLARAVGGSGARPAGRQSSRFLRHDLGRNHRADAGRAGCGPRMSLASIPAIRPSSARQRGADPAAHRTRNRIRNHPWRLVVHGRRGRSGPGTDAAGAFANRHPDPGRGAARRCRPARNWRWNSRVIAPRWFSS